MGKKVIIQHLYSETSGNKPSSLELGEIAINHADKKLFISDGDDGIVEIGSGEGSSGDCPFESGDGENSVILKNSGSVATGNFATAIGSNCTASCDYSHAEGANTITKDVMWTEEMYAERKIQVGEDNEFDSWNSSIGRCRLEGNDIRVLSSDRLYTSTLYTVSTNGDIYSCSINGYIHYINVTTKMIFGGSLSLNQDGQCAHTEGNGTKAYGSYSHAEGSGTTAYGTSSHAEGSGTTTYGLASHAEGYFTKASGQYSHAEGDGTTASGYISHAEGQSTTASGWYGSHAEGYGTTASGNYGSHAEGSGTTASHVASHAEGQGTTASGYASHAEGYYTTASGEASHAEGSGTTANNRSEHASGSYNLSTSHPSGTLTFNGSNVATLFSVGNGTNSNNRHNAFEIKQSGDIYIADTDAEGEYYKKPMVRLQDLINQQGQSDDCPFESGEGENSAVLKGSNNVATGKFAMAINSGCTASGNLSFAEGDRTTASSEASHAEGGCTTASGSGSHAEGSRTTANGKSCHAEGHYTIASSNFSHAEGYYTTASGNYGSHAEGSGTTANSEASHAEGSNTKASGDASHAEGYETIASGQYSHAEGCKTYTSNKYEHASGVRNVSATASSDFGHFGNTLFTVGNGLLDGDSSEDSHGHNAIEIKQNGDIYIADTSASGAYYEKPMIKLQDALNGIDFVGSYENIMFERGSGGNSIQQKGALNNASGQYSFAHGSGTTASGIFSHAEGLESVASGARSHAEGASTTASNYAAHAEGTETSAIGPKTHAEGWKTSARGSQSHAEGEGSVASGMSCHAEGYNTTAMGNFCHAEGNITMAGGVGGINGAHAEGSETTASSNYSHAEGHGATASGHASHAEGWYTQATDEGSHSEGKSTKALGEYSHSEGSHTTASSVFSHAEGFNTLASGGHSHAEGQGTTASSIDSHAEGQKTLASGMRSHAEGYSTTASGVNSHSEGQNTQAIGDMSHTCGGGTIANNEAEFACGEHNVSTKNSDTFGDSENTLFSIGNGIRSVKHNAFEVRQNGDIYIANTNINVGNQYETPMIRLQDLINNTGGGGNYTLTKSAVENVLTGNITSHTHSQYLTSHQSLSSCVKTSSVVQTTGTSTSNIMSQKAVSDLLSNLPQVVWIKIKLMPNSDTINTVEVGGAVTTTTSLYNLLNESVKTPSKPIHFTLYMTPDLTAGIETGMHTPTSIRTDNYGTVYIYFSAPIDVTKDSGVYFCEVNINETGVVKFIRRDRLGM